MRWIKYVLLAMFVVLVTAYFASNYVLEKASRAVLARAGQQAKSMGVELDAVDYRSVRISSLRSITWYDTNVRFRVSDERLGANEAAFQVSIAELTMRLPGYSLQTVQITARDFNAAPVGDAMQQLIVTDPKLDKAFQAGSVEGRVFETTVAVNLNQPLQSAKSLAGELFDIAQTGRTKADIHFEGRARMRVRGSDMEAKILSVKTGSDTRFVLDKEDVARIAERFDDKLSEPEIAIIVDNPAKAPKLFSIKDYAETTSETAFANDRTVPEDPYRHVLWSYLLTREFGPEFSKAVTDAHEEGPTGNTPLQRKQDYQNNTVGRRYAAEGVPESEILRRVRTDPRVMR
jgi:hypothetical protein